MLHLKLFLPGSIAFVITVALMPVMIKLAGKFRFTDDPSERDEWRRVHEKPVANGGGIVLFIGFAVPCLIFFPFNGAYASLLAGAFVLTVFGTLDDRFDLPARIQILAPIAAALFVTFKGYHIRYLTNPFDGYIDLSALLWLSHLLTVLWIVGMIVTVKFLDGVDGLSAGVGTIAAATLGCVALLVPGDEATASLAFLLAGALLGYLLWNWHPAQIYYGEAGAMMVGFVLAVIAILSVGKLTVALLVMGIPVLDTARVILLRFFRGQKPWRGGRDHLHHILYDSGLGARGTATVLCLLSGLLGIAAFVLQQLEKHSG